MYIIGFKSGSNFYTLPICRTAALCLQPGDFLLGVRFVDKEADKKRSDWKLSVRWAWFIGENREPLKLTTKPEPYTLDRTLRWIQRQVDPTLKMLETITAKTGIDYLKEIRKSTKLTEKHYKIIEQQTTSTEDVILEKEN